MNDSQRSDLWHEPLAIDRRGALKWGLLGAGGLSLAELLRREASGGAAAARSGNSVILLHMRGGPSQLETWDMKPHAPVEIRGEFQPISTSVPGIQICELLPQTAKIMHKWSIVRSLEHPKEYGDVSHSRGDQVVFTGHPPGPNADENIHPSVGSVISRQLQPLDRSMLAYVMVPRKIPGTGSAYLGPACEPFESQADPANRGAKFEVPNLAPPPGLAAERIDDRRGLARSLDRLRERAEQCAAMAAMDAYEQQAWELITGPRVRKAFDLDAEPASLRERYGYPPRYKARMRAGGDNPGWNQRLLLARRLVEAGVRMVTVDLRWWDTHDDNFWSLRNGFLPPFDQAYSALIEDLETRGLLETTLVVAWGEHGRTPRINKTAGRDHWMSAFSAALAGGGVQGGRAIGATDSHAAAVKENPKHPQDVLATIYRHLGVDANEHYADHAGRPVRVLPFGAPIDELF
ncbi:MAG: DUF1501 domain-containing protein [Planctomycetales bacterium]|nr:DUF1501 domain-containing protein [Planctomycetales bacterium]